MLFDAVVTLSKAGTVESVDWLNQKLHEEWEKIPSGNERETFSHLSAQRGEMHWREADYDYERLVLPDGGQLVFLKKNDYLLELFQAAADLLEEGIQLYDKNATLLYLNQPSMQLGSFQSGSYPLVGEHLLDLYQVDDISSTTMTTLRTRKPVINRFANYQTLSGKPLITVNSGYPVFVNDKLVGAVDFETDVNALCKKKERLEKISVALEEQIASGLYTKKSSTYTFNDYIGHHQKILDALELARSVATRDSNVLLLGETGTGKEIFAQSIHENSLRRKKKFVALNCAAVPEQLVESILFGTEKGSFTGSMEKRGLFEEANGGTIYLDELNSMSLSMQSKLLRVLQEGVFRRLGGSEEIRTSARIISSCNENVFDLIRENKLRRDLFYRVATIMIDLPPLREHMEDLEELIWHRIKQSSANYALSFTEIDPQALWLMQRYKWPGNVRELNHVIDYALTIADDEVFLTEHLPQYLLDAVGATEDIIKRRGNAEPPALITGSLQNMLDAYAERIIRQTLADTDGNVSQAAELLGVKRQSLQYRLRKYQKK